jgi:WD repeat-containing protein 61
VQWDSVSGQQIRSLPPHTLGVVSLSAPVLGEMALYNTVEGMTGLWDLASGEVKGRHDSYLGKKEGLDPGQRKAG